MVIGYMASIVYSSLVRLQFGTILITANNKELLGVSFTEEKYSENENALTKQVKQELIEYIEGKRFSFSTYQYQLSSLQQRIFDTVSQVSYGKVVTYSQLAKKAGLRSSVQTVANTLTNNPYIILIPSHRVVTDERKLYRYKGGIERKRRLLLLEKRYVKRLTDVK